MLPAAASRAGRDGALQKALAIGEGLARELCSRGCRAAERVSVFLNNWIPVIKQCAHGWECSRQQPFLGSHGHCTWS